VLCVLLSFIINIHRTQIAPRRVLDRGHRIQIHSLSEGGLSQRVNFACGGRMIQHANTITMVS